MTRHLHWTFTGQFSPCSVCGHNKNFQMWQNDWTFSGEHLLRDRLHAAFESVSFEIRVRKLDNVQLQNDWISYLNIFKPKKFNLVHWTFLTAFKIDWTTLNITEHDWTRLDKVAERRNILHWTNVQCMFSANFQSFCQRLTLKSIQNSEIRGVVRS